MVAVVAFADDKLPKTHPPYMQTREEMNKKKLKQRQQALYTAPLKEQPTD